MQLGWLAPLTLLLAACATKPLVPDAAIDLLGRWTVVAVDGEATGGGERFNFRIEQPYGSAQFGCNAGSGPLRVERGGVVAGDWIITVAGCGPERMRFERRGFEIIGEPMAFEALVNGAIRLRNRVGSIDLERAPAVALNIEGEWTAVAIDGVATEPADRFPLTITPTTISANLCNMIDGGYRLDGLQLARVGPWRSTERGCFDPTGKRDPMAAEEKVFAILSSALTAATPTPNSLKLMSPRGSIDFVRGSPLSLAIVGEWTAVAFDGRPAAPADRFLLTVTPTMITTTGLCNDVRGHYRMVARRIEAVGPPWPRSEKGCPARQRLDDRAWTVLGAAWTPSFTMLGPDRMCVTSARGSIDFERRVGR